MEVLAALLIVPALISPFFYDEGDVPVAAPIDGQLDYAGRK